MKQLFLSILALFIAFGAFAQKTSADVARFKSDVIDLGNIPQNVPAKAVFTVTNVGKTPLIIEQANPTCGCTIGDYTKSPIDLGKDGTVSATYNAANAGYFSKTIKVKFAGFDDLRDLTIKGTVVAADAKGSAADLKIDNSPVVDSKTKVKSDSDGVKVKTTETKTSGKKVTHKRKHSAKKA